MSDLHHLSCMLLSSSQAEFKAAVVRAEPLLIVYQHPKTLIDLPRYRNSLRHDVSRLGTAAVKRRYPPSMVPGQEREEITLVQSDIEGSTEIWEWLASWLANSMLGFCECSVHQMSELLPCCNQYCPSNNPDPGTHTTPVFGHHLMRSMDHSSGVVACKQHVMGVNLFCSHCLSDMHVCCATHGSILRVQS